MHESVIISFFITLGKKIFEIYNDSFLEKIIKSICDFFIRMSKGSFICGLFSNKWLDGSFWRNSLIFKIITFPVWLLMKIGSLAGEKLRKLRENSRLLKVFDNLLYIPLRQYGWLLLSFTLASAVSVVISSSLTKINIVFSAALLVLSLVLLIIPCSLYELSRSSRIFGFFANIFNHYEISSKTYHDTFNIEPFKTLVVLFAAAGFISGFFSPLLVLVSIFGAALMVLILSNTMAGIFITVFAAPVSPTMVCAGLCILTAISFVLKLLREKDRTYVISPMSFLVVSFLLLATFSTLTSFNLTKSLQVLMIYIAFAIPYFLIVNNIKTKNQWFNLVITFVLAGFVVSLYGIYQNFFVDVTNSSWIDEDMFSEIGARVYSTFGNPNVLGQFLVLAAPVSFAAMWSVKKPSAKFMLLVITAVMFGCLVLTWSRAAWVGIVLAVGFYLLMKDRRWSALCILGLLILPFVLPETIISRITSIGNLKDSSTAYRVSIWIASLRMAKDYWISGIGLGSGAFERVYQNYALNGAGFALHSHNFYIELVVEMGILGLILFLLIMFMSYKQTYSIKERNSANKNVSLAICGAFLGYMFQGVAENLWYNYRMILIFWICLALLQSGVMLTKNTPCDTIGIKGGTK